MQRVLFVESKETDIFVVVQSHPLWVQITLQNLKPLGLFHTHTPVVTVRFISAGSRNKCKSTVVFTHAGRRAGAGRDATEHTVGSRSPAVEKFSSGVRD